jgi:hypothetical protein
MLKKMISDITINCIYITIPSLISTGILKKDIYWVIIPSIVLFRIFTDKNTRKPIEVFWNKAKSDMPNFKYDESCLERLYL